MPAVVTALWTKFEFWLKYELTDESWARDCMPLYATIVIAAKMAITTITINNSTIVKPFLLPVFTFYAPYLWLLCPGTLFVKKHKTRRQVSLSTLQRFPNATHKRT